MDPEKFTITFNSGTYGKFDRCLYDLLARDLLRQPLECLYVIALWMWLERGGFTHFVCTVYALPSFLIHELADEALVCLRILNPDFCYVSNSTEIPLTCNFLHPHISLNFFRRSRPSAFNEITDLVNIVCLPSVSDIIAGPLHSSTGQSAFPLESSTPNEGMGKRESIALGKRPVGVGSETTPVIDRILFVTFCKGYPLDEFDVYNFFMDNTYGGIASFSMHNLGPLEPFFYARIIFNSGYDIPALLKGAPRGKFYINRKPVWLRKFVQRDDTEPDCKCPSLDACLCER